MHRTQGIVGTGEFSRGGSFTGNDLRLYATYTSVISPYRDAHYRNECSVNRFGGQPGVYHDSSVQSEKYQQLFITEDQWFWS